MNLTHEIIAAATKADSELIPVIERIMREDIFHGTLDWQTSEELEDAAVQAYEIYNTDKVFFDADTTFRKARWARILAEKRATEDRQSLVLQSAFETAQKAEGTALSDLQSFSGTSV